MLLRRITEHVKAQNWFAVAIDFFIVVVGVFIGIQVSNWNVARSEREFDQRYMHRLHDEIETSDAANSLITNELTLTVALASEVAEIVSGNEGINSLTRDQCDAVFASHIYRPGRVSIPTVDELIASGRVSIISDDPLRKAILSLSQLRKATDDFNARISGDAVELHRKYPELISLNHQLTYDRFGSAPYGGHKCYLERMLENDGFKNDLVDNLYRMDSYVKLAHGPELQAFTRIHAALDRILDYEHEVKGGEQ